MKVRNNNHKCNRYHDNSSTDGMLTAALVVKLAITKK